MKLFVYYKFLPVEQPQIKTRVEQMQAKLQSMFVALRPQVMMRPKPDELGQVTWMEIYDLSAVDFDEFKEALDLASNRAELPQPRRTEQFINCSGL
jgi:hypothetical protein